MCPTRLQAPLLLYYENSSHTKASRRKRQGAGEDPKQATGVVSSLEGSQTRRGAEAVPHARRLKHRAATGNIASPMPTTLTVSSAREFPRRAFVQRASNVGQPDRCLAAAGTVRADGSTLKQETGSEKAAFVAHSMRRGGHRAEVFWDFTLRRDPCCEITAISHHL